MNETARIEAHFDRVARSFDAIYSGEKGRVGRTWDRLTRQNIRERLEFTLRALSPVEGRRVLDVGCGSGRYCHELAARGARVVGIDVSQRMLDLAEELSRERDTGDRCTFIRADILAFEDPAGFDDAVAMGMFDYIRDPLPLLHRLRSLARGGLIASFPCRWAARVPARRLWLHVHGCPVYFYSRSTVERLCEAAGFRPAVLVRRGPIYLVRAE